IWDFNLTYGNDLFDFGLDRSHYDVWQFDNGDNEGAKFWKDLFNNPTYRCYFSRRWNELTAPGQPLKHNNLVIFIDNTVNYISEAVVRENEQWNTIPNHALEIDNLKTWLYQRINWITANIGSPTACSGILTPPLVINRINYNPGTSVSFPVSNDQEFIEIKNTGTATVDLTGVYFRELGISYVFPSASSVAGGQSVYLASNTTVFQSRYGFPAFGQFARNLSNGAQKLVLADPFGNVIDRVEYTDSAPWPNADGNGSYLQLTDTALDNNIASSWIAVNTTLSADAFLMAGASVYPNPVHGKLTVNSPTEVSDVKILDVSGKLIRVIPGHAKTMDINFSDFSNGLYFVKITAEGYSKTEKIIKQ
ncbi:MAG TPA: lamin tail domain-containing protein, partial [Flavobacterium sp.]|nr:lamin tail domain-containing protein [Flavobacterium sp.]